MLKFFKALARATDPQTSKDAANVDTEDLSMMVYRVIESHGAYGCISDQVLAHKSLRGISYGAITPRYAELLRKGFITTSTSRRAKSNRQQRVMRAAKWQS
jgi:hypothetical protein